MFFKKNGKNSTKSHFKGKLLYVFYNILWLIILLPVCVLVFLRYRQYPCHSARFGERLAFFSSRKAANKNIWLHTASVGEVNAALPLLQELIRQYGSDCILVTTTTPTGEQVLKKALGHTVDHLYLPFDIFLLTRRFLAKLKPHVIILFETEVWPSLIVEAKNNNSNIVLVNARMSENSKNKYLKFQAFSSFIFDCLSLIVAQTKDDAHRFGELGAPSCQVSGSLKYSIAIDKCSADFSKKIKAQWVSAIGGKKIIIAASTHPLEEDIILEAFIKLKSAGVNSLLILVPRHVERAGEVEALCLEQSLSLMRLCDTQAPSHNTDVVLVDAVGKLFNLFGLADVAIMGGTFISRGGHNFLEPAAWGLPIVSGESDYNFSEIAKGLKSCHALTQVSNSESLANTLELLLVDDALANRQGDNAKKYIEKNSDVVGKMLSNIEPFLPKKTQSL